MDGGFIAREGAIGPMESQEAALSWIVDLLRARSSPFQVVGGLAARAYGATRALADIDIYVPAETLVRILPDIEPYVTRPPRRHADAHWDLMFLQLEYAGTRIEIAASEGARYCDARTGEWRDADVDYDRSETRVVLGVEVPVMPRRDLLEYKRRLGRDVDIADVEEIVRAGR